MTNPPWGHPHPIRPGDVMSPYDIDPTRHIPRYPTAESVSATRERPRRQSPKLVGTIAVLLILAVTVAGLGAAELYARHRAAAFIRAAIECSVGDTASVRFAALPPFLWQHLKGTYTAIDIQTSGGHIRRAQGMQIRAAIRDLQWRDNVAVARSLQAQLTWTSDGIRESIKSAIPLLGPLLTDVTTNPDDNTVELGSSLASITLRPRSNSNGGVSLDIVDAAGPGLAAVTDLQPILDAYLVPRTSSILPPGVRAQSVEVTKTGVIAHFSAQQATLTAADNANCWSP
ncbi:LmeA family phospholipid-binding protein [Mycolicibacterium sp.]|uniref:LmeA family phospholipid-binding protein n=1 Tax=Mycolicibacterium sp. TaxID=2320850 RepID=UPI0037C8EC93